MKRGGRVLDAKRAIRVSHNYRHIAQALGYQGGSEINQCLSRNIEKIVAQRQIFDGVSGEGQFACEENLSTLVISLSGELEKALDIARPVAHNRVSLGQGQAKTRHTK